MNPCQWTVFVTALANGLACRLDTDEIGLLGAIIAQLGDTLNTIAVQKNFCSHSDVSEHSKTS